MSGISEYLKSRHEPCVHRITGYPEHAKLLSLILSSDDVGSVSICSPWITRRAVNAILASLGYDLSDRCVTVYTDPAKSKDDTPEAIATLRSRGVRVVEMRRLHSKTLAVDDDILFEGSFNWLSACGPPYEEINSSLMLCGGDVARSLVKSFREDMEAFNDGEA